MLLNHYLRISQTKGFGLEIHSTWKIKTHYFKSLCVHYVIWLTFWLIKVRNASKQDHESYVHYRVILILLNLAGLTMIDFTLIMTLL